MRLQRIALKAFRSYAEEQTVEIDRHLTLLAGRNNVGKSALLRAFQIPVERQEGVGTDFSITYTWSVSAEDVIPHAAGSPEMTAWMLSGEDPQSLIVTWRGKDSNLRRQSQCVYSASPLTAREPRRSVWRIAVSGSWEDAGGVRVRSRTPHTSGHPGAPSSLLRPAPRGCTSGVHPRPARKVGRSARR
jgi:hypothetical protein